MPPSPAVGSVDLSGIELSGNRVEACQSSRPNIPNDRQDVGHKLQRLRLAAVIRPVF
jgi:hypothetical protein